MSLTKVGEGVLELVDELDEIGVHGGQSGWRVVKVVEVVVEDGGESHSSDQLFTGRRQKRVATADTRLGASLGA